MIQDGSVGKVCPSAIPNWSPIASVGDADLIAGNVSTFDYNSLNEQVQEYWSQHPPPAQTDSRATEDCLFLDVIVPKEIFDSRQVHHPRRRWNTGGGAPVVIWYVTISC